MKDNLPKTEVVIDASSPAAPLVAPARNWLWRWLGDLPIAYKLAMAVSCVLVLGIGLLMSVVMSYNARLLDEQIDTYGRIIAEQFAASVTEPLFTDDLMSMQVMAVNLIKEERISGVAIIDDQGQAVVRAGEVWALDQQQAGRQTEQESGQQPEQQQDQPLAQHQSEIVQVDKNGGIIYMSPVRFQDVTAGKVLINFTPVEVSRNFDKMISATVTVTLLMLLLVMLVAYWMSRRIARPIETLVRATEQIGAGDYQVTLPVRGGDEIGRMFTAINRMGVELDEKHRMRDILARVVATDVAAALMNDRSSEPLKSSRVDASVLFVDMVGFTAMTERSTPEYVVNLLNEYFTYVTLCSQLFFGSVDKFIGDGAMIMFGVPRQDDNHRFHAIACAVVIQRLLVEVNQQRQRDGLPRLEARIGINSGEMMAGTIGARQRMEYTVIGDAVNLAARLAEKAAPGQILAGQATLNHPTLEQRVSARQHSSLVIKGKQEPVVAFAIESISQEYLHMMENLIDDVLNNYPGSAINPAATPISKH